MIYNIFGSEDSIDIDVMVYVDTIPNTEDGKNKCAELEKQLSEELQTRSFSIDESSYKQIKENEEPKLSQEIIKKVNVNLAIVKDGIIVDCFKGTPDEVNNSVFFTYVLHKQKYECMVKRKVIRDIQLKCARSVRIILSFLSRTEHRDKVKFALKGGFHDKLKVLKEINIAKLDDLGKNNQSLEDFYKVVAFQIGQCFSLIHLYEQEIYTKNQVIENFPELAPFIKREKIKDKSYIEKIKIGFVGVLSMVYDRKDIVEHTNWRKNS